MKIRALPLVFKHNLVEYFSRFEKRIVSSDSFSGKESLEMETVRGWKTRFLVVLCVLSVIPLFGFFSMCIYSLSTLHTMTGHDNSSTMLKILRFNPSIGESSTVMIEAFDDLSPDDYIFIEGNEGEYNLISNVQSQEYVCYGTCYCWNEERRSSAVIRSGMIYLLAGMSSLVMLKKANNYFEKRCFDELSTKCVESAIQSQVDVCEEVVTMRSEEKKKRRKHRYYDDDTTGEILIDDPIPFEVIPDIDVEALEQHEKDLIGKRSWKCFGKCLVNHKLKRPNQLAEAIRSGCSKWETDALVYPLHELRDTLDFSKAAYTLGKREMEAAKRSFEESDLKEYCKKRTQKEFKYDIDEGKWLVEKVNLCSASTEDNFINPTIWCIQFPQEGIPDDPDKYFGEKPDFDLSTL